jgi:deoxycytidine triphosphate deaminase
MLSDKDIISELQKGIAGGSPARLVDQFPREGKTDWSALSFSDAQWNAADSPIQPSSIDLHVGHIYIPGAQPGALGAAGRGAMSHTLKPGHSVIVSTYERICIPSTLGGIVFPPSKLSSNAILVANLGHIDPGFSGHLRFTLINMGGRDFSLERGRVAVGTLLLFTLSSKSAMSWAERRPSEVLKGEPDRAEIDALAKDFADIASRISRITKTTVKREYLKFSMLAVLVPILFGIALANWAIWFETGKLISDRMDKDEQSIADMRVSLATIDAASTPRIELFDHEIARLRADLETTERDLSALRSRTGSNDAEKRQKP